MRNKIVTSIIEVFTLIQRLQIARDSLIKGKGSLVGTGSREKTRRSMDGLPFYENVPNGIERRNIARAPRHGTAMESRQPSESTAWRGSNCSTAIDSTSMAHRSSLLSVYWKIHMHAVKPYQNCGEALGELDSDHFNRFTTHFLQGRSLRREVRQDSVS